MVCELYLNKVVIKNSKKTIDMKFRKVILGRWWCVCKNWVDGASLVAQWLGIRLPMQGTWVRALVQEDPTCRGATKPVHHNY